jgi:4-oxalocrotonate tautomerase
MPFVHIWVAGRTLSFEQVGHLQRGATTLMASIMRKNPGLTAVLVEQVPAPAWSVGARSLDAAAHLEVKVTAGTNTAEEKERFIAAATRLLHQAVEELPIVTYVVVDEVPGDAGGYGGRTQDNRRLDEQSRASAVTADALHAGIREHALAGTQDPLTRTTSHGSLRDYREKAVTARATHLSGLLESGLSRLSTLASRERTRLKHLWTALAGKLAQDWQGDRSIRGSDYPATRGCGSSLCPGH